MGEAITSLIAELQRAIRFVDLRKVALTGDYLEAVLLRGDLDRCCELLSRVFGPPVKEFGAHAALTPQAQQTAEVVGGIRANQCFFFLENEAKDAAYAALWPWESDPVRLTLKIGTRQEA